MPRETTRLLPNRRPPLLSLPLSQSLRSEISVELVQKYRDGDSLHLDLDRPDRDFDWFAYVSYYLPLLRWVPKYRSEHFAGDILAGVSLASFQIPLVMSLATSLARLPPLAGLYSAAVAALTYAVFGGVPTLVVGPLPSSAVLFGQTIERLTHDPTNPFSGLSPVEISATAAAGMSAVLLAAGLLRYGFLDNVLSRALLKGFIGAMGVVMITNQLAIQMGLQELAVTLPHASMVDKWVFAASHIQMAHIPTVSITVCTLVIVLFVGKSKRYLEQHGVRAAVYVPELLGMIVIATWVSYCYDWNGMGVAIVGDLTKSGDAGPAAAGPVVNPFHWSRLSLFKAVFSTSFLCSVLGFFDSTTATKALGAKYNYNVSSNRELVALGMCNLAVTFVGGLPSFGALGRSKVNILAGARSPLATVVMGITILVAIRYLLAYLYYLPECVLSLSTTIIGITVLEEVPHEVAFFWSIDGYDEIAILSLVFCATIFWSVEAGVVLGVMIAVVRVIKHGSRSRIHILGRIPNTSVFRNADELIEESFAHFAERSDNTDNPEDSAGVAEMEQIEGVLIIKIPEPLNFANLGDLRSKLTRIEKFGTLSVHPSQPLARGFEHGAIKVVIFDCKGMTAIDASSTQMLYEIVKRYTEDEIHVGFARVAMDSDVRSRFVKLGIMAMVNSAYDKFCALTPSTVAMNVSALLGDGFFLSIEEALRAFQVDMV